MEDFLHMNDHGQMPRKINFEKVKLEKIYFKEMIDSEFRRYPMPDNIRKHRNIAIILIAFQIVCAISSLALYLRRKVIYSLFTY